MSGKNGRPDSVMPAEVLTALLPAFESLAGWQKGFAAQLAPTLEALQQLALSRPNDFRVPESNTAYSLEMQSPADYFSATEVEVKTFDELHKLTRSLSMRNPDLRLLWRGQRDSSWGMHSQLFRALMIRNAVRPPNGTHRAAEPYPTEDQMVEAEAEILRIAREEWRLGEVPAMEIFARVQHFGAPTRLLDVSRNPYVAAWFAVESHDASDDKSARLFALATEPPLDSERMRAARLVTQLSGSLANTYTPFWHGLHTSEERQQLDWGTGGIRRYWIPPVFEQRISAQNAGFVLDGVPMSAPATAPYFAKPRETSKYWKRADLLAASSIYAKLYSQSRRVSENRARPFAPTFTFRITPAGKRDIRRVLEEAFSYSRSTVYPDVQGLARYLSDLYPAT